MVPSFFLILSRVNELEQEMDLMKESDTLALASMV